MVGKPQPPKISTVSQRPNTNKDATKKDAPPQSQRSTSSQNNQNVSFMKGSNK